MTLTNSGFRLRQRNFWEAFDAGLLLWRKNFIYFLPLFAIPFWICAFALWLLPENIHRWSWLALWVLKPLFDRPVLHIISVRFFEQDSRMKKLLKGFWHTIFRALPGDLLWRRFSPYRSVVMPMRILENVKFKEAKRRKHILGMGGIYKGALLTVWGIALSAVLLGGEILFSFMMLDLIQKDYISSLSAFFSDSAIFIYTAWCINYMLVESMYVCMGFGLYINSRIEVEGWDLEILFRDISRKKKSPLFTVLALCTMLGLFMPVTAMAAESGANAGNQIEQAVPLETLEEIISSGEFGGERDGWGIRLKNPLEPKETPDYDLSPWMEKIKMFFAAALRFILVLLIAAIAVLVFIYIRKNYHPKAHIKAKTKISQRFNRKGESAELLLEKAQVCYKNGEIRSAWAYCFAAALGFWEQYKNIIFPGTATEYECLRIVRSAKNNSGEKLSDAKESEFAYLVAQWAGLAYGGRIPGEEAFEKAITHCKSLELHHA